MSFWDFFSAYSLCPLIFFYICSFLFYTGIPASLHPGQTVIYIEKAENVTYGNTNIVHNYPEAHRKVLVNRKSILLYLNMIIQYKVTSDWFKTIICKGNKTSYRVFHCHRLIFLLYPSPSNFHSIQMKNPQNEHTM